MKRAVSFVLSVLLVFCLSVFAMASETNPEDLVPGSSGIVLYSDSVTVVSGVDDLAIDTPILGGYYVDVMTGELGALRIYIPVNYIDGYLSYSDSGSLINISASTITGYAYDDSGDLYTVRWSTFSLPQYRLYEGIGYSYEDLTITAVEGTNVSILGSDPGQVISDSILLMILCVFVGVILLTRFMKH